MKLTKFRFPWSRKSFLTGREDVESEIVEMTDELIEETLGINGIVTTEFEKRKNYYNAQTAPISPEEARSILVSMVKLAASQRSKLAGRISTCVESGALYGRYHKDFKKVSKLAVKNSELRKCTESAREEYLFEERDYRRNRMHAYVAHNLTPEQEADVKDQTDSLDALPNDGGEF